MAQTTLNRKSLLSHLVGGIRPDRFQTAVSRAYQTFAQQHPQWADSLFDQHFLAHHLFRTPWTTRMIPDPRAVAEAWTHQFNYRDEAMRQRHVDEFIPVAAAFLQLLEAERCGSKSLSGQATILSQAGNAAH